MQRIVEIVSSGFFLLVQVKLALERHFHSGHRVGHGVSTLLSSRGIEGARVCGLWYEGFAPQIANVATSRAPCIACITVASCYG